MLVKVKNHSVVRSIIFNCCRQLLSILVQVYGDVHFVRKFRKNHTTLKLIFWLTLVKSPFLALIVTSDVILEAILNIIKGIHTSVRNHLELFLISWLQIHCRKNQYFLVLSNGGVHFARKSWEAKETWKSTLGFILEKNHFLVLTANISVTQREIFWFTKEKFISTKCIN